MAWTINEHEEYVAFISPEGFSFEFNNTTGIFATIVACIEQTNIVYTRNNERIAVEQDSGLRLVDCDPWINNGFQRNQHVGFADELAKILIHFISETYYEQSDSHRVLPRLPR